VIGWLKYCLLALFVAAFGEFVESRIVYLRKVTSPHVRSLGVFTLKI
jgi:hypothetical protein